MNFFDYSSKFLKKDSSIDNDWFFRQVQEDVLAEQQLFVLCNYTLSFLNTAPSAASEYNCLPMATPLATMTFASVRINGRRFALETGECAFRGTFGSFQGSAKQNASNMEQVVELAQNLTEIVVNYKTTLTRNFS